VKNNGDTNTIRIIFLIFGNETNAFLILLKVRLNFSKILKIYFMDIFLLIIGFALMIIGVLGSFLPVLPGPSISWLGLVLLYATHAVEANYWVIGICFLFTVILSVLDYVIPSKGTKKFGGSSYGIWGTNIGLVVGIFAPIPFGFIIGPFVGAFIGEMLYDKNQQRALKAATGSFIGFIASSFMKFVFCMMYLGLFLWIVWKHKSVLF
jgi:uncharacterized protein YqgC (DUF456 family)